MRDDMPPMIREAQERLLREASAPWWLVHPVGGAIWGFPIPWDRPTQIGRSKDGQIAIGSDVTAPIVEILPTSGAFQANVVGIVEDAAPSAPVLLNGVVRDRLTLGDHDRIAVGDTIIWFMDLTASTDDWLMRPGELTFGPIDGSPMPQVWVERIGPFLSDSDLDTQEHGGGLSVRTRTSTLLAVNDGFGHKLYPAFQFDTDTSEPYEVLRTVVPMFRDARIDDYTSASWFKSPRPLLEEMTPADWMAAHRSDDTLLKAARRSLAHMGQ